MTDDLGPNWLDIATLTEKDFRENRKKEGWDQATIDTVAEALRGRFKKDEKDG